MGISDQVAKQSTQATATPVKRQSTRATATPVKKQSTEATAAPVKRGRPSAKPLTEFVLEEKVLEAASKADMLEQLHNLAGRPDVLALKKTPQELLDALTANNGLVNAAKHSLLGA